MFKKFIYWFIGVNFWKTASKPRKIFVISYSLAIMTWMFWSLSREYREDRRLEAELKEESEPDIFTMD